MEKTIITIYQGKPLYNQVILDDVHNMETSHVILFYYDSVIIMKGSPP